MRIPDSAEPGPKEHLGRPSAGLARRRARSRLSSCDRVIDLLLRRSARIVLHLPRAACTEAFVGRLLNVAGGDPGYLLENIRVDLVRWIVTQVATLGTSVPHSTLYSTCYCHFPVAQSARNTAYGSEGVDKNAARNTPSTYGSPSKSGAGGASSCCRFDLTVCFATLIDFKLFFLP